MKPGSTGPCPHCKVGVRFENTSVLKAGHDFGTLEPIEFVTKSGFRVEVSSSGCPACGKPIIFALGAASPQGGQRVDALLWPDTGERPVPSEVESEAPSLAADFREAVAVFPKSKKASAALSRRCLQFALQHRGDTRSRDLSKQIDEVLPRLPSQLATNVDAIRHVGNFAAHPIKATTSGQIVDVEEGEAEWLLDVLEELFDYYYVAPAKAAARRDALNAKLQELGKPPLKAPQIGREDDA